MKPKITAPMTTVNWHNATELPELQCLRNRVSGFKSKSQLLCLLQVLFKETGEQDSFSGKRTDNSEGTGCFSDNSPGLERRCSILLTRRIHMADRKALGDFLHVLKIEERIEASFILRRKRKYGIIMLRGNNKFAAIVKTFINLSCRLMGRCFSQVSYVIAWEKCQSFISKEERPVKPCYKATCANLKSSKQKLWTAPSSRWAKAYHVGLVPARNICLVHQNLKQILLMWS